MEWRGFVMKPIMFDPLNTDVDLWPAGNEAERHYISQVARLGIAKLIGNVRTQWRALRSGARVFPVTINHGEVGDSYVCLPHSAYILYAQQELDIVKIGWAKPLLRLLIKSADRLLIWADINRIVHVDNWMLSTNLHGDWEGHDIAAIRQYLVSAYPHHIIAIRSIDPWSSPTLLEAAKNDGWRLLPSRQIWVTDDLPTRWAKRKDAHNDRRQLRKSGLTAEKLKVLRPGDCERIAELYHMLYVGKYSPLNPIFSPKWIEMTHQCGLMDYQVARDQNGLIQTVSGSWIRGDILTSPIVGYDTDRPISEGLYRIASYFISQMTAESGLRLNGSAGAANFKRNRGAVGVIEYSAMYVDHLSFKRRAILWLLEFILVKMAVPVMKTQQL
jgi:hypothetical protein